MNAKLFRFKQQGSVTISYLAMLVPMLVASVATIVIGYQVQLSNRAMQAAEAASLACEYRGEYDAVTAQRYLDYYQPKVEAVTSVLGSNRGCQVDMGYQLSTVFSGFSLSDASFTAESNATEKAHIVETPTSESLELVLVLDISSSMLGDIDELKRILNTALSSLRDKQRNADNQDYIKVSVVPFSDGVSVLTPPWYDKSGVFCAEALTEPNGSFSAQATVANLDVTHDQLAVDMTEPNRWLSDCNPASPTLPLTSDLEQVITAIDGLNVSGGTSSYQGLIWGLRQLTPNWQNAWNVGPNQNDSNVKRKLVLMTDGADNDSVFDTLLSHGLCSEASSLYGVELNFIGFDVADARLEQFYRCTGDPQAVFSARDTVDLDNYFSQILSVEYDTIINFGNN